MVKNHVVIGSLDRPRSFGEYMTPDKNNVESESIKILKIKAEQEGNTDAQFLLGMMYELGASVPQSNEEAVKWYRMAAEQGNAEAQENLDRINGGNYLSRNNENLGLFFKAIINSSINLVRKYAEQGSAKAQYDLGMMYEVGFGVTQSDKEAVKWFRKAADQGHTEAQKKLDAILKK